ncbi:hypothetical protein TH5_09110 [Thalassospira xianhensis MCCC 1A02616]|uniref:Uncharacterized protein n=2 Tax=Thalassospira xianhensis TaxID=478503 RepID=A0A367UDW5_9PROT|nr:hypothetical protein TH5_09110 [Thalassospira xianhensis MCCC 1A02616]
MKFDKLYRKLRSSFTMPLAFSDDFKSIAPQLGEADALSMLAVVFETSVYNLKLLLENKTPIPSAHHWTCLKPKQDLIDPYWGHLGIKLRTGDGVTHWYPITWSTREYIMGKLDTFGEMQNQWLQVQTLNNKALVFDPLLVERIWLLDEASQDSETSPSTEDWFPSPEAQGLYESALSLHRDEELEGDGVLRGFVQSFLEDKGIHIDDIEGKFRTTVVHTKEGCKIESVTMAECAHETYTYLSGRSIMRLQSDHGEYHSFVPRDAIVLVELPLCDVHAIEDELAKEFV